MPHARSAHRAPRGLLSRPPAQHLNPEPPAHEPRQTLQLLLTGLAALILTSIVVLVGFFVVAEERRGHGGGTSAAPPALSPSAISSRKADPAPLTRKEVFPSNEIRMVTGAAPYEVSVTHVDSDCSRATTGELDTLLLDHGCSQIVRAKMVAPYGDYQVTAGIFNLADDTGADEAASLAGQILETGRGGFTPIGSLGDFGDPSDLPLAQAGWQARGHFLLYCLISRPDGQLVTDDDPYARRITADMIDQYLADDIVAARSTKL